MTADPHGLPSVARPTDQMDELKRENYVRGLKRLRWGATLASPAPVLFECLSTTTGRH